MSLPTPISPDAGSDAAVETAGDVQRTLARYMDWAVREWRAQLAAVAKKQEGYLPPGERDDLASLREFTQSAINAFARIGQGDPVRLDHLTPAEYSWLDISNEMARDEAAGWTLWAKVRQAAREELAGGVVAGQAIEGYHPRPYERAAFLAIREALADGLQPRNAMEWLLTDGMAQAWTLYLRWLGKHVKAESLDAIQVERDVRQREGWQPPRL